MKGFALKHVVLGMSMVAAAVASIVLKPTIRLADSVRIDLEQLVPKTIGSWTLDPTVVPLAPNPQLQEAIADVYDQTLARTYIDSSGRRVMLSIAYSADPARVVDLHTPDICYPAQGFRTTPRERSSVDTGTGAVTVTRMVASKANRIEPITYWLMTGENATPDKLSWRLVQLEYGLKGKIPDGMLVRVSSIGSDKTQAFDLQDQFIRAFTGSMSSEARRHFIGRQG